MSRKTWILVAVVLSVLVACLAYGIYLGDPGYVFANALAVCYT